jgi:hypothetical protein
MVEMRGPALLSLRPIPHKLVESHLCGTLHDSCG